MKQNITVEQANKLSEKGKQRLFVWIGEKPYHANLSIGQMIEFLDEKTGGLDLDLMVDNGMVDGNAYISGETLPTREIELCDALWEAVKEELEK